VHGDLVWPTRVAHTCCCRGCRFGWPQVACRWRVCREQALCFGIIVINDGVNNFSIPHKSCKWLALAAARRAGGLCCRGSGGSGSGCEPRSPLRLRSAQRSALVKA
jgi:hypothetical protein